MNSFIYEYPIKTFFGEGCVGQHLSQQLQNYGKTVLLAYGQGSIKKNGIYEEITGILKDAGKTIIEFAGIMPNPTYDKVQEGAAFVRENHVDFILAVGGGSVIDCCKVVAAQAETEQDIWEMEFSDHRYPEKWVPMEAVVTAAGTGSEMNSGAVITNESQRIKAGVFGAHANFAFLDPAYTLSLPKEQVLSGAFDTLSHAMETYLGTSDQDNVSDGVALAVMRNTVVNMRRLLVNINDKQARSNLLWDAAMAENGILKCGRLTDFQAHQIEHQLGAYTDCNHGQGLAVIHPAYYRHIVGSASEKFTRFAKVVFDVDTAEAGVEALADFIRECGLPARLGELRSKAEITPELLRKVADSCNIIKSNPRQLDKDEIYQILMECM